MRSFSFVGLSFYTFPTTKKWCKPNKNQIQASLKRRNIYSILLFYVMDFSLFSTWQPCKITYQGSKSKQLHQIFFREALKISMNFNQFCFCLYFEEYLDNGVEIIFSLLYSQTRNCGVTRRTSARYGVDYGFESRTKDVNNNGSYFCCHDILVWVGGMPW